MIPYDLDITSTPFCDTTIISYELDIPPSGIKIGLNLLDNNEFTIPYILDIVPNSPYVHQLSTQSKKYLFIVSIHGGEQLTEKQLLDELQ